MSIADSGAGEGGSSIPGTAQLSRLFVDPEHWGRGVGSELLRHAVEEMRRRDYDRAELLTPAGNERARALYERRGWRLVGDTLLWRGLKLVRYTLDVRSA